MMIFLLLSTVCINGSYIVPTVCPYTMVERSPLYAFNGDYSCELKK
jgi:hypothetical protein